MNMKAFYISEDDAPILEQMIDQYRRRNQASEVNPPGQSEDPFNSDDQLTPEVYVAKVPSGGIPARSLVSGEYRPGIATCTICKLWPGSTTALEIVETHFDQPVRNVSSVAVAESSLYKIVQRDKFGHWVTENTVSAGGTTIIHFEILSVGPFLGELSDYCLTVLAEVLDVSCDSSDGVSIGDEVVIWDTSGCYFDIPNIILEQMRGTAVKMTWSTSSSTGTGTGTVSPVPGRDGGVSTCVDDLGSGTGWVEGECWWLVQSLCCGEEVRW